MMDTNESCRISSTSIMEKEKNEMWRESLDPLQNIQYEIHVEDIPFPN